MNTSLLHRTLSSVAFVALPVFIGWSGMAHATGRDDQWYLGFGGTGAFLDPDPVQPGNNANETSDGGGTLLIGKDLDERSSVQFQAFYLGEAVLDDGNSVQFNAADASVVYRFFDTRDNNLNNSVFGTSLYGRFGLGFASRDSDTDLEREDDVYFGAGAGFETYLHRNVAIRGEAFFHDIDVVSASLSVIFRLGGKRRVVGLTPAPTTTTEQPQTQQISPDAPGEQEIPGTQITTDSPTRPSIPSVAQSIDDADRDGVPDAVDNCLSSTRGYPVRENGCPLFDGVLSGVRFVEGATDITRDSTVQLDFLIDMLVNKHPSARIELHSHTDNEGDVRSQAVLTRGRLRTVGTYLIDGGVSANRIVLRSFGGSRPLFDNSSAEGRASNNRIEILERPR